MTTLASIPLHFIAHSRCGDKGDTLTMSLIPYDAGDYELLEDQVSAELVKRHFGAICRGCVRRYPLPTLRCFNFVLENALDGGVNTSLRLDRHGKSLSSYFLMLKVDVPRDHPAVERMEGFGC